MENLIKKWRKKAKLTQQELANKLFLTRQAISQYENGKREPSFHLLEQAAKICNQPFTTTMQEEFLMKKITFEEAKETMMEYEEVPGLIVLHEKDVEALLSNEGNIYMTQVFDKNPRKAVSYATANLHLEEKYLKEAKGVFAAIKGPSTTFMFEDIGYLQEHVCNLIGDETDVIFQAVLHEEDSEEYEVVIIAMGYPTKKWTEDDLENKDAVFEKVLLFKEKMLEKDIKEKDVLVCTELGNYLIDFRKADIFTFVEMYTYTKKNTKDEIKFMMTDKLNSITVLNRTVNPQKLANIIEQLTEKNINQLVNNSFTKIE